MLFPACHTMTLPVHTPPVNVAVMGKMGRGEPDPAVAMTLALPLKPVTVKPWASRAVSVSVNGIPWTCCAPIVLTPNDATGPGWTANTLLEATMPAPLSTRNVTPESTPLTVTLPDHLPEVNLIDVGVIVSGPFWPKAESETVPP